MWKTVLLGAVGHFVGGLLAGLLGNAIGFTDTSPLEFAVILAPVGAVVTAMEERRRRDR